MKRNIKIFILNSFLFILEILVATHWLQEVLKRFYIENNPGFYHATKVTFFLSVPTVMSSLGLLGACVAILGAVLFFLQIIRGKFCHKAAWYLQGIGIVFFVLAYIACVIDFLNNAGSFG